MVQNKASVYMSTWTWSAAPTTRNGKFCCLNQIEFIFFLSNWINSNQIKTVWYQMETKSVHNIMHMFVLYANTIIFSCSANQKKKNKQQPSIDSWCARWRWYVYFNYVHVRLEPHDAKFMWKNVSFVDEQVACCM